MEKLLSKILGHNVEALGNTVENTLYYGRIIDGKIETVSINIYELMFLCKEYAKKVHDKYIYSSLSGAFIIQERTHNRKRFKEGSEPECVFKACEWLEEGN